MKYTPENQERVWAVIAHLSALAMGMGLLLPIIGWSESRRKSNYTSFQCLQALGYQSLGYTIWILSTLVFLVIIGVVSVFGASVFENFEEMMFGLVITHVLLMLGLIGIYFALPIVGAIACAMGRDFRYPLMGNRLATYLGYDNVENDKEAWLVEEHEDRWVVSMGHFCVIIPLWGLIAPIAAWVVQGKRNLFLKFQSAQTIVFQAGTMLLYGVAGVMYFGGAFFLILSAGLSGLPDIGSPIGIVGISAFGVSMLCAFFIVLIVPLLHIMGQWAGYRILKGDDYRYPLVGRWVERWLVKQTVENKEQT